MILSPSSRQVLNKSTTVYLEGIFHGTERRRYSVEFKRKAVDIYLKAGLGYKTIAKQLDIRHSMVVRWVRHFRDESSKGLEDKRGKQTGPNKSRPKTELMSQ